MLFPLLPEPIVLKFCHVRNQFFGLPEHNGKPKVNKKEAEPGGGYHHEHHQQRQQHGPLNAPLIKPPLSDDAKAQQNVKGN